MSKDVINVKQKFWCLRGTTNAGISYSTDGSDEVLEAFCDADYAGDSETIHWCVKQ